LLARVAVGDQAAFDAMYDRVAAPVFGTVRSVVRDPGLTEEVTQEVFVEVWRAASRFDASKGSPMAWVATIAHRRAVDRVRPIGGPVRLLGCSDGAVVALTVALRRPDLVRRLVFGAGVFHPDGWAAGVLDGEPPDFLEQSYGELSPDGIGHYRVMVGKLADMHAREPALTGADLRALACRTLVMVADDDEVRLEHAIEAYRSMPDAELAVVPGTSHGLLVEKPGLCNLLITEFFTKEPVPTFAPIRRAAPETR
jgi:pimeloyl-ACP methyl ester carboxylesterase